MTRFEPSDPPTNGLMATFDFTIKRIKKAKLPGKPLFLPLATFSVQKNYDNIFYGKYTNIHIVGYNIGQT